MKIDLHTHTAASPDSTIPPRALAKKAGELGIVPAITDHYSMGSIPEMRETGIKFIPGEELRVSTPHGRADLIGLFMNECIRKDEQVREAMDLLRSQGALIYAPHPFDSFRYGLKDPKLLKQADIIEVFNPHSSPTDNRSAEEFAAKEKKLKGTGSDCHFLFEFGHTYTEVELDELEPKKLLKALENANLVKKKSSRLRRIVHRAASTFLKPLV